jgi:septum formation protein
MKLYLASRSPRRHELLARLGVPFETIDVEIDERWDGRETPEGHAMRLAREKARAGLALAGNDSCVLGADTVVAVGSEVLGQPADARQAAAMLAKLSGSRHRVLSAVALAGAAESAALSISDVSFRPLGAREIDDCCRGGEPLGKAGGYAIQGMAAAFVVRLDGSYSAVMGLPLAETRRLLAEAGIVTAEVGIWNVEGRMQGNNPARCTIRSVP